MLEPLLATSRKDNVPRSLKGFEHINRYWDSHENCIAAKILPGEYYVTLQEEMVVTVLGSCVSACIRDKIFGIGGMNHFMLPDGGAGSNQPLDEAARYGVYAMELLINDILKNGGRRENLEIKITGGGRILSNMLDIGRKNIDFVRSFIATEGLTLAAEEVGGVYPRKVYYFPSTGKVKVKKLRTMHNDTVARRENDYLQDLRKHAPQGDVELF